MPALPVLPPDPAPPDLLGRRLHDLRISVTDRCNFRCVYCMPIEVFGRDAAFVPRDELLTYEEMARLAAVFVSLGVEKVRVTGGEPLVRRDLPDFIAMLDGDPRARATSPSRRTGPRSLAWRGRSPTPACGASPSAWTRSTRRRSPG